MDAPRLFDDALPVGDFELFYQAYPRKKARQVAERAWLKLKPSPEMAARIVAHVELMNATEWKDKDPQFIPFPATFLNQHRWTDAPDVTHERKQVNVSHTQHGRFDRFVKGRGEPDRVH